jgi:hypothetical protein
MNTDNTAIKKFFSGRKMLIATKHQKEKVLKPVLEQYLEVNAVTTYIDTDRFGTFTGEVDRERSAFETARQKCIVANELTGETLILASEGSFGAHPVLGFVPADEEMLLLKDFVHGVEYRAKVISTQTNFAGAMHFEWEQVLFFASQVKFPSHGLIVKKEKDDTSEVLKDINDWSKLKEAFIYFQNKYGKAFVETDMRAMYNPTRMKVIEEAAHKLVSVISTTCPICSSPGFEVKDVIRGLPCSYCNTPTQTAKAYVHSCQFCGHSESRSLEKKQKEDPMFCDECNP